MIWVFLVMIVSQVYDNVTSRATPVSRAAAPTAEAAPKPDDAIQKLTSARSCVAADPKNLQCTMALADLYYSMGQYPQAQAAFESALKLDPRNAGALLKLGGSYIRQQNYAQAVPTLEQAISFQPDSPELHLLLGLALSKANPPQKQRALSEWRRVLQLAPGSDWSKQAGQYITQAGAQP